MIDANDFLKHIDRARVAFQSAVLYRAQRGQAYHSRGFDPSYIHLLPSRFEIRHGTPDPNNISVLNNWRFYQFSEQSLKAAGLDVKKGDKAFELLGITRDDFYYDFASVCIEAAQGFILTEKFRQAFTHSGFG